MNHYIFCKGITKDGYPCVRKIKKGEIYCKSHNGVYEECGICYDDMQCKTVLECGHSFCTSCLNNCSIACPMCRKHTNFRRILTDQSIQKLSIKIGKMDFLHPDEKMNNAYDIFNLSMQLHSVLLPKKEFFKNLESKLNEFSEQGMNTDKYKKQMLSYIQTIR